MFVGLKNYIKQNPFLYNVYTNIRYHNMSRNTNWVIKNLKYLSKNKLKPFVFRNDNAYVLFDQGVEFLFVKERADGGLLGLEKYTDFEKGEMDYVLSNVADGSTVIDIGANFGLYTVSLAKKNPNIKIHSFEPVESTFRLLKHNVEHNNVTEKATLNNCALGEEKGKLEVTVDRYAGNHLVMGSKSDNITQKVDVLVLDEYVKHQHIDKVDFIKCDVEGAELLVLRGAVEILKKDKPNMLLEIADEWTKRFGYRAEELMDFLCDLGYKYKIFSDKGEILESSDSKEDDLLKGSNFVFYV